MWEKLNFTLSYVCFFNFITINEVLSVNVANFFFILQFLKAKFFTNISFNFLGKILA